MEWNAEHFPGLTDASGLIIRPALRAAWDRIVESHGKHTWDGLRAADAFLRTICHVAAYRGIDPAEVADRWGY